MTAILEKGGGAFHGIRLLLCENPLPPLDEAIAAAQAELPLSNYYTEAFSRRPPKLLDDSDAVVDRPRNALRIAPAPRGQISYPAPQGTAENWSFPMRVDSSASFRSTFRIASVVFSTTSGFSEMLSIPSATKNSANSG